MTNAIYWRCFHCGDAFTKAQAKHARYHFGRDEGETPVCLIREPGEYHVLRALRQAQDELAGYRAEDTELHRALHAMSSDIAKPSFVRRSAAMPKASLMPARTPYPPGSQRKGACDESSQANETA